MATKYNFSLFKKKHKFFNYCHTDTGAQYSDLNLNQNLKGLKIFPIQSDSKSYNNKKIDYTLSESYEEKEKSQTWKMTDLCSKYSNNLSLSYETEKCWKKNGSSNATNNSTLSLRISAYENSNEVSSDSLNKSFKKSLLIEKQKRINPASTLVSQSPFEFQRQRNDKVPEPEVSQFKSSQRLFNLNKSGLHSNTAAIAAESRRASSTAAFDLLKRNKMADSQYQIVERGSLHSLDYRIFFKGPNGFISPWHDIPLFADESKKIYNMIVEIPRWTNAKMEMATKEPLTPIKQDEKKGLPRFVNNIFPHRGYIWNYGALPQTWEDPNHLDSNTNAKGDNDPIDVIEIGSQIQNRGAVVQVKILGTLALLDEGETDWKLVAIAASDPLFDKVNHINDVEEHFPGLLKATEEWFRIYKIPTGKPANEIAFNGEFKDAEFANEIIAETHQFWKNLIKETSPKLNTEAHVEGAAFIANDEEWKKAVETSPPLSDPKEAPADNDKWHFIRLP